MTSTLSALIGGGGVPVGASIQALDAPLNFVSGAAEYLRAGSIKPYDASYAAAIAAAPQLRVFGSDAKTLGPGAGTYSPRTIFIGTNYVSLQGSGAPSYYGTTLAAVAAKTNSGNMPSGSSGLLRRFPVNGTAFAVVPAGSSTPPKYTSDGIAWTMLSPGGSFGSYPNPTAACFGNNSWLLLSALANGAAEQTYIAAASPAGAWTVGSSGANLGMVTARGLAYGAGVFCAVGDSSSATAGKIATCAAVGGAWTDRTAASGIVFAAAEIVVDVVFDGTVFIALTSTNRIITSTTGTGTWVLRSMPFDASAVSPIGTATGAVTPVNLVTDGAGTTVLVPNSSPTTRPIFAVSTDHGVTWSIFQTYIGKVAQSNGQKTLDYVNGRWVECHGGDVTALQDLGASLATPDYVGQQHSFAIGSAVRIK